MRHKLAVLYEIVEVSGGVDHSQNIVENRSLITFLFDSIQKALKVIVRNAELVKKAVLLE